MHWSSNITPQTKFHTFSMNMNTSERITAMALKLPLHGSIGAFRGGAKVFGPPPVSGRGVVRSLGGRVAYGPLPPIGFDQHTKSKCTFQCLSKPKRIW